MKINEQLVKKVRNGEAAIEHSQNVDDLPKLKQVLGSISVLGWDKYYYFLSSGEWHSTHNHIPSGMTAYKLKDFFVEEVEEKPVSDFSTFMSKVLSPSEPVDKVEGGWIQENETWTKLSDSFRDIAHQYKEGKIDYRFIFSWFQQQQFKYELKEH